MLLLEIFFALLAGPVCQDNADVLAIDGSRRLYTEVRLRTPCRGLRERDSVRYLRPDGSLLGTKSIRWRANQDLPEFDLRMDAVLKRVSLRYAGDTALVDLDRKGKLESYRIPLAPGTVADAGIDSWIARNLSKLVAGASMQVPVLVPEFHRVLTFSVRAIPADPSRPSETRIELAPSSWLLRTLSTPLVVAYEAHSGDLKAFTGVSDIKGPEGKNYKVRMRYAGWSPKD